MIPAQLQNSEFRFIKVAARSKRPIENDWQETANYPYNSQELKDYLARGGNYGIICGPGEIRILDCDNLARLEELGVLAKFPRTFSVQSRPGRIHRYYMVPELKKKITLFDPILKDDNGQPCHLGEIQGPGTQIIGPGSIHQNTGKPYEIIDDSPIAALSLDQVTHALEGLKTSRFKANCARLDAMPKRAVPKDDDPFKHVRIDDVAYPNGETRRIGDEIQGAHPVHGSTTGKNFRIDLKKNTWYCDRCHTGGGPALWIAVKNGIIRCDQAAAGALRGEDFKKVWRIAENEGLIAKSGPTFKKLEKKEKKEPEITLDDVTDVEVINQGKENERIERSFSPDKAADAVIQAMHIVSTPDEKIWIYQEGIYKPNGETFIDQVLDRVAGDKYTLRSASEVHRKIVLRTLEDFSVFDSNPYLFCVENGVIDTRTGIFSEHSPENYLTLKSPITYDPEAHCPVIARFLKDSLGSDDNILSILDILTAKTTTLNFEYFAAAIGGGSNGKSVLEELIRKFFGDEQVAEVEIATLTQNKFDKIQLYGKRFLINSEVSGDVKESRTIKAVSGGMRIDADQKNKNHVQFRPHCFIFIDTNNPPRFSDNTHGFARRLVKVDFPFKFVDSPVLPNEKQRDPDLLTKMIQPREISGLLNLLIANAPRVLDQKIIHQRGSGQELAEEYDLQSNSIAAFYDKFVEEADLGTWISSTATYDCYKEFCKLINASPVRDRDFFAYAKKQFRAIKGRETTPSGKIRVFYGLDFDDEKYKSFVNRTIIGPALDQQEQQQDQQDQQDQQKRILLLIEREIFYKENKVVSAGLAGPVGPDSVLAGLEDGPSETSMNGDQVDSVLKRCLAIVQRAKNEVTPFILSIHAEGLDADIPPKQCEAWMRAHDWTQEGGKWSHEGS